MGVESRSGKAEKLNPFESRQKELLATIDKVATKGESYGSALKMSHLEGWRTPLGDLFDLYERNPEKNKGAFKELEKAFKRFRKFASDPDRVRQDQYARSVVIEMSLRFEKLKPKEQVDAFEIKRNELLMTINRVAIKSESHGSALKMSHLEGWRTPLGDLFDLYERNPEKNKSVLRDLEEAFKRFRKFASDPDRVRQDQYARNVIAEMSARFEKLG